MVVTTTTADLTSATSTEFAAITEFLVLDIGYPNCGGCYVVAGFTITSLSGSNDDLTASSLGTL
jgi:hypothetical protein